MLLKYLQEKREEFNIIYNSYLKEKYKLDSMKDIYQNDIYNIFDVNNAYNEDTKNIAEKLLPYINQELQFYKKEKLEYIDLLSKIQELNKEIILQIEGPMISRATQKQGTARDSLIKSKHYLKSFKIRLDYYINILNLLINMEDFEKNNPEIIIDEFYDMFCLDRCILLNQVIYYKKKCLSYVEELNNRTCLSNAYFAEFYYKLGELNFNLQKYHTADLFFERAIKKTLQELNNVTSDESKNKLHNILFSSYKMQIMGYEFCGNYEKAIVKQISGKTEAGAKNHIQSLIKKIEAEIDFDNLLFDFNKDDFQKIEDFIKKIFVEDFFTSEFFKYVIEPKNMNIFKKIADNENAKLRNIVDNIGINQSKISRVMEKNEIIIDNNYLLIEYIHLLAHCLNEYGVILFREKPYNGIEEESEENFERNLIILSRVLMYYVANKNSAFKSCCATIYAEIGDYDSALTLLSSMINTDRNIATSTKAENAFFYYLISSMNKIEKNESLETEDIVKAYNQYLNYCYRSFDYDAIAHIKIFEFKNKIAPFVRQSDFNEFALKMKDYYEKNKSGEIKDYKNFIENIYTDNSNNRLKKEYEKVKNMYIFLSKLAEKFDPDRYTLDVDFELLNKAFIFLYYYDSILNNYHNEKIKYIEFESDDVYDQLENIISGIQSNDKKNIYTSQHCALVRYELIDSENFITECQNIAKNKLVFIAADNDNLDINFTANNERIIILPKEKAVKEFFIFNIYFMIYEDFVNSHNIFVMTPIGNAESCQYNLTRNINLLDMTSFHFEKEVIEDIDDKYAAVSFIRNGYESCEDLFYNINHQENIKFIIEFSYAEVNKLESIKYKFKLNNNDAWKEAVLFRPQYGITKNDSAFRTLYTQNRSRIIHTPCFNGDAARGRCCVREIDVNNNNIMNLKKSFLNVTWEGVTKILIWTTQNLTNAAVDSVIRILGISMNEQNANATFISDLKKRLCRYDTHHRYNISHDWPEPSDPNNKYYFISHLGADDDLVKLELNSFFAKNDIPIWYDKEQIIDESWKEKIKRIIENDNCVGSFILVTSNQFFASQAIKFEIDLIKKHKVKNSNFKIYPVVYKGLDINSLIDAGYSPNEVEIMRDMLNRDGSIIKLIGEQRLHNYNANSIFERGNDILRSINNY